MQQPDEAAGVRDRLVVPEDWLVGSGAGVLDGGGVLGFEMLLGVRGRVEEEEEGVDGAGDECQEVGIAEGEHVVEG